MREGYLLLLSSILFLGQTCSLNSGLDKYDDYTFADKDKTDAGKPDADDAGETWWQRYARLSAKASPACESVEQKYLYCTGGVELEVDLTCPDHCHAVTGRHCFCPYKRGYRNARAICQSTDMHLIKIDNRDENELIGGLLVDMGIASDKEKSGTNSVNGATWIGLNDLDEEGTFVWPDGSETTYHSWAYHQPDDLTGPEGEDCVAIQVAGDKTILWYDYPCEFYEGMEKARLREATHFFFCETQNANKTIGNRSVAFISDNTDPCQRPSSFTPGETCCTTMADVAATGPAIEPGRCGTTIPGFGTLCMQFCQPGHVDYESGCPERILTVGAPPSPPCCTILGNDRAGYFCGAWDATASIGCVANPATTASCPKPSAYKGPDEPLVKYEKCGDVECELTYPEELAWAEQCCTKQEDVEVLLAIETEQCGLNYSSWGSKYCSQLNQKGELDETCPIIYDFPNNPISELASMTEPGCCTESGVCGSLDRVTNLGCHPARNNLEEPYQLCRRANKDEKIGVDPLLSAISYNYRNQTGISEVRSKNYGNCDDPIQYNNNSYYFCQGPLEWGQARAACEWKKDRYLVHVDDTEENDFLHERFQNSPFWIGAYTTDASVVPDDWLWSDTDEPFFMGYGYQCQSSRGQRYWETINNSYVNWAGCDDFPEDPAQPNDDDGVEENCAQIRPDGYWTSEDYAIQQGFVCEEIGVDGVT